MATCCGDGTQPAEFLKSRFGFTFDACKRRDIRVVAESEPVALAQMRLSGC